MQNPLENFLLNLAEKIKIEKEYKEIIKNSESVDVNKDVFAGFIEGIANTIKENVKNEPTEEKPSLPDPLDNFLSTLGEKLKNLPEKKKEEEPVKENEPVKQEEPVEEPKPVETKPENEPIKSEENETPDAFAGFVNNLANILKKTPEQKTEQPVENEKPKEQVNDYVKVLSNNKKVKTPEIKNVEKKPEENEETPDIKKFVANFVTKELDSFKNDLTEKYLKKAAVLSEYAGGGGSVAVQYANGGVMNGDLNVNANYLSGGVNLLDIFALQPDLDNQTLSFNESNAQLSISNGNTVSLSALSGGGGGGGPTDRLVSGSYQVVLSSNGAVTFPDNLTIDNSTISNLTLNDYGGGSSVLSGSQIEVFGDRATITNGVTSTAGASILAARGQVTLDSNKAVMEYGVINSLGGESVLISQGRFAVDNDVVMEQVVTNSLGEGISLIAQNQVIVNSNVLIGRRVTNILDGNTTTDFSGWTFDNGYGSLTFPNSTTQTTAFTGNPDSSNWDSTYTTVKDTSGYWSQAYTNLISNSSAYLSGVDISLITTTSASWNSVYTNVNSNSSNYALTNTNVTFQNDVTVLGNLTAKGTATFANTIFTTTSALSVVNTGPGPALYVFQASGPSDVASFYDGDGVEVLHVGNAQGGGNPLGQVGINTSFPSAELTVNGAISGNKAITVSGGNSNQWNSTYTTLNTNSGKYESTYTTLNTNSGKYESAYTTTNTFSSSWTDFASTVSIETNTVILELSAFSYFLINLNANITTMTFNNPKIAPQITSFVLQLSADGTIRSVTWPVSVRWPGGTAPIITNTVNKVDTYTFFSYDGGISYYGFPAGYNS